MDMIRVMAKLRPQSRAMQKDGSLKYRVFFNSEWIDVTAPDVEWIAPSIHQANKTISEMNPLSYNLTDAVTNKGINIVHNISEIPSFICKICDGSLPQTKILMGDKLLYKIKHLICY